MGARVDFPYFEHLHYYDQVRDARLNISYSNVREFTFGEFRRELPKDLDLNWANTNGPERLRKMIAGRHGTGVDRVLMTTGATEGNFVVNASVVRPGDRVLVDSPIYSPLRDVPTGLGAQVIRISRACDDGWRLDLDRWRAEAKAGARLLVFANLGNPTSEALSRTEIGEVAEIAEESEAYVLVDETFRELAFERRPPSVAQFGPRMIALSTITKVCGLGTLRAGSWRGSVGSRTTPRVGTPRWGSSSRRGRLNGGGSSSGEPVESSPETGRSCGRRSPKCLHSRPRCLPSGPSYSRTASSTSARSRTTS